MFRDASQTPFLRGSRPRCLRSRHSGVPKSKLPTTKRLLLKIVHCRRDGVRCLMKDKVGKDMWDEDIPWIMFVGYPKSILRYTECKTYTSCSFTKVQVGSSSDSEASSEGSLFIPLVRRNSSLRLVLRLFFELWVPGYPAPRGPRGAGYPPFPFFPE